MRIPRDSVELQPVPYMHVVCRVHGLGLNHMLKQNVFPFILLIPLAELTNQRRGIYRYRILYLL